MAPRSKAHAALGTAIRQLRTERAISQEDLAYEASLNRTYMGDVERGERNIAYENIIRVAHALGTTGSALLAHAERHGANVNTLPARPPRRSRRTRASSDHDRRVR